MPLIVGDWNLFDRWRVLPHGRKDRETYAMIYRQGSHVNSNRGGLDNKSEHHAPTSPEGAIRELIVSRMDELDIDVWELGRRARLCHTTAWRFVRGRGGISTGALLPILEVLDLEIAPRNPEGVGR